jgi:hypothetical protein
MSKRRNECIGRIALLLLGLLLIWGAIKSFRGAAAYGAGLFVIVGIVLMLLGGGFALAALAPLRILEKVAGPRRDQKEGSVDGSWFDLLFEIFTWW